MDLGHVAKFIYAAVFAALTSASVIYVEVPAITIALAAVGAVGVYFVPNSPARVDDGDADHPLR